MSGYPLTDRQQAAVRLRGRSVLVSAAAGAGKTLVLVERLMSYVTDPENPRDIDEFLLITYTRAAAGEMRVRILKALRERIEASPDDQHLRRQLNKLYTAHISTLHAYCMELLREFSAQSGLAPDVRIGEEAELSALREATLDRVLESLYGQAGGESAEAAAFQRFADAFVDMRGDRRLAQQIERLWMQTRSLRHDRAWRETELTRCRDAARWEEMLLSSARDSVSRWAKKLRRARQAIDDPALEKAYGGALDADLLRIEELLGCIAAGWDSAFACLSAYSFDKLGSAAKAGDRERAAVILAVRNEWKAEVKRLAGLIGCPHTENVEDLNDTSEILEGLFYAAQRFEEAYRAEKALRRIADFTDIENAALRLLTDGGDGRSEIGTVVSGRFCEIMVDEYQDINSNQDAIIGALSRDGANVFYVGDVRQSIYKFQQAEPALFLSKYETYPDYREQLPGPCKVELATNFRSDGRILEAVNGLFGGLMTKKGAEIPYGAPLEAGRGSTGDAGRCVELRITHTDGGEDSGLLQEARAVAHRLKQLIDSGEARAGDCVILLSSFAAKAPAYHAALAELGLSGVSDAQNDKFFESHAVRAITALLETVRNPRNDVSLLAALRCPALAYTPDELAALRAASDGELFDCLVADPSPKSARVRAMLEDWRELAPEIPVWRLVSRILTQSGLPSCVDGRGQAELDAFLELAAASPEHSLAGFLNWLAHRDGGVRVAARADGDAIRIMSVHKSKGLEFPVVVAADLSKRYNLQDCHERLLMHRDLGFALKRRLGVQEYPTVAHNAIRYRLEFEKKAEELRVLYVAMTRAEKRLILSGRAVKPLNTDFEEDPPDGLVARSSGHMQLLLSGAPDGGEALWERTEGPPPAPSEPPDSDRAGGRDDADEEAPPPYPYAAAVDLPSKLTVTDLKGRFADHEVREDTLTPAPDGIAPPERRSGLTASERGQAVHLAMQFIDFSACTGAEGIREELRRMRDKGILSREQHEAVHPDRLAGFFLSALGRRVLGAKRLWRECKFSMLENAFLLTGVPGSEEEEILFQGVIDCFFEEDGGAVLLDFKTDRVRPGSEAERAELHRGQLEAYARAIRRMTGLEVREKYIWFFATDTGVPL